MLFDTGKLLLGMAAGQLKKAAICRRNEDNQRFRLCRVVGLVERTRLHSHWKASQSTLLLQMT
jgi:hypothetical protein